MAADLALGKVTERQGMHYFLASTLIVLAQTQYALWWGPRSGWLFAFEFFILAVAACVGCWMAWKANNGREFVLRVICLSVPSGLQVFVLSLVFGFVLDQNATHLFDPQTFRDPGYAYELVSYAGFVGFTLYFWLLIYRGMLAISRITDPCSDRASP